MSHHGSQKEPHIPLGVALISIGAVVLLFAGLGWVAWTAVNAPANLPPILQEIPTRVAAANLPLPAPVAPADAPVPVDEEAPILLPESPLPGAESPRYPSHATVAEAGRRIAGQPTRITIPRLGIDAPVSPVSLEPVTIGGEAFYQWAVPPRYEGGWHTGSAPLGEPGNTVINGHNNTLGEVFRNLVQLEAGDEVVVADASASHRYVVEQVLTLPEQGQPTSVRVENARWIEATEDERLTLVSCWPYNTNSHRLVVVARPAAAPAPDN